MIITRTPYRVSFFGGGTDISAWYAENGGSILSTAIDHYSWISLRWHPPFNAYRHRIIWSQHEKPDFIADIQHPAIRAALQHLNITDARGIELNTMSDLPARAGLGSSSTFTAGLLQGLHTLLGSSLSTTELAQQAIHLERTVLNEAGGIQDQIAAAFGNLNEITINPNGSFTVQPLNLAPTQQTALEDHCLLFFSGLSRSAHAIETAKTANFGNKKADLSEMQRQALIGANLLRQGQIEDFGRLLHEAWLLKRGLSTGVSTSEIDTLYTKAKQAGALGGKLLGAGGGGFFLVFAAPEHHQAIKQALAQFIYVPFRVSPTGCTVVVNTPRTYEDEVYHRREHIYPPSTETEKAPAA